MNEWILLAQQTTSGIGDNSLAATIVSGAAMIVTAMLKLMPEKGKTAEVPAGVPESVDQRLRALENDFARFEGTIVEKFDNHSKQVTQMQNDMRELFQELRRDRPHQGGG